SPYVPCLIDKRLERRIVYVKQHLVGMVLGSHDPWLFLEQRSENRVGTCRALGAWHAYSNPDLPARLVQPATVGPHHRHREPHRSTLRYRTRRRSEPNVTLPG